MTARASMTIHAIYQTNMKKSTKKKAVLSDLSKKEQLKWLRKEGLPSLAKLLEMTDWDKHTK